jgi:hypothetical protein
MDYSVKMQTTNYRDKFQHIMDRMGEVHMRIKEVLIESQNKRAKVKMQNWLGGWLLLDHYIRKDPLLSINVCCSSLKWI